MNIIRQRGVTLVELSIAIAIFVIGFLPLLMGFGVGLDRINKAKDITIANQLVRAEINYLKNINFPPTTNDRETEFNRTRSPSADNDKYDIEVISVPETGCEDAYGNDLVKKVTINVYKRDGTEPLVIFKTYISRNGI